ALVRQPLDQALALQVPEVLVHRGQGGEPEVTADLLERRRIAVLVDVLAQVVEHLLLPLGHHRPAPPKGVARVSEGKANGNVPGDCAGLDTAYLAQIRP